MRCAGYMRAGSARSCSVLVTWFVAASLIRVSGATRELTEGVTALFAAAILLYVGFWLHAKSHAAAWKAFVQDHVQGA